MMRLSYPAVCLIAALSQIIVAAAQASGPPIVGASSGEHLWFVIEEQRPTREQLPRIYRLYHHASPMGDALLSSESMVPAMSQYPEAMAAWESQLWLVNEFQPNQELPRREVFTLRVKYEPTFEVYQHEPRERLLSVEPLPAEGKLSGFVATASGPVALLTPTERGTSSIVLPDGTPQRETELSHPRLLALTNGKWEDVPLPDGLADDAQVRLGASLGGEGVLHLFAAQRGAGETALYRLLPDGWARTSIPVSAAEIRQSTHVLGQCAVVLEDRDGMASVVIIRPSDALQVAQFQAPEAAWTVLGLVGDLRLVTRGGAMQIFMQRIDPLTGSIGEREAFRTLRPSAASLVHLPLLLFLAIIAVAVAYAMGKSNAAAPLQLPETLVVLGPVGRLMALVIDMAPAGLITMFFLRSEFADLLRPPLFVARLDLAVPYLVMAGLTVLHSGIWELANGSSLGKSLMGSKVTDLHGRRLSTSATLIRIAFKAVVLYVPLLAIFNLMNSRGQGLGDRAVGAVVVAEQEQPPKPE